MCACKEHGGICGRNWTSPWVQAWFGFGPAELARQNLVDSASVELDTDTRGSNLAMYPWHVLVVSRHRGLMGLARGRTGLACCGTVSVRNLWRLGQACCCRGICSQYCPMPDTARGEILRCMAFQASMRLQ